MGGGQGGAKDVALGVSTGGLYTAAKTLKDIASPDLKKIPKPLDPIQNLKPIPAIDDAAVKAARNNQLVSLQQRSGRASTQLSGTQGTKTTFGS